MSYDALGVSDAMLDSLSIQLREAELRRSEAERAHQDALAQLRGVSNIGRGSGEPMETLQSRARELEKKAALETVRCEELQLELSAALKSKSGRPSSNVTSLSSSIGVSNTGGSTVTWAPTPTHHLPHHPTQLSGFSSQQSSSQHMQQKQQAQSGSEIDRIMAKIEQDNRILAELEHSRTTGPSTNIMTTSISGIMSSSGGLASASGMMGLNNLTNTGIGGVNSMLGGVTSSSSSHGLTGILGTTASAYDGFNSTIVSSSIGNTLNNNVSPLHLRGSAQNCTGSTTVIPPLCQSSTMPVLSLHNTYSLPSGSASYTLGLSGAPGGASSYTYPTSGVTGGVSSILGATNLSGTGLSSHLGTSGLGGVGTGLTHLSGYNPNSSYSTYTNPLISSGTMNMKLKTYDDLDMLGRYGNRTSPSSPIPQSNWGLDSYSGLDGVNPTFMHTQRPLSRLGGLDLESRAHGLTMNGSGEPQVDMLDIPGKGRCCVFIARFSYDPPDESEGELSLCAGDYLLVWGSGEPQSGYFDAELLDGRRGLVPASFVQRLIGDDLLEFHQAVVSTLRDADDIPVPLDPAPALPPIQPNNPLLTHTSEDMARLSETHGDLGSDHHEDEADTVPAPRHLTLERQLNKSVLIGWSIPDPPGCHQIESYHVYVDGVLKVTVKANERTRALVEGVDSNKPHRISVRSVTQNRRTSRDAACTMIIGRDTAHLGPSAVRAGNITCSSAIISWLPANSNHQHVVCVNNVEVRTVKPGVYRHTITGLAPSTQYRVTVRAKHLRAAGQAPPPGPPPEEAPGAYTDFRTLAKGLPDPPQEIQVEAGPQDGTLLVTWQPVNRPPSSGPVTGYAVYADGKKVTDVDSPTGDHALIDIGKLVGLNPRAVTVRTKSRDAQSSDSQPTLIPNMVRNAARSRHNVPHSGLPPHMRNNQQQQQRGMTMGPQQQQQQQQQQMLMQNQTQLPMNPNQPQQILDHHDENLSDKEVLPGSMHQQGQMVTQQANGTGGIPSIEITKDSIELLSPCGDDTMEYQENIMGTGRRRSSVAMPQKHISQSQHHHQQQQAMQQHHQNSQHQMGTGGYQQNQSGVISRNTACRPTGQQNIPNQNQPYYVQGSNMPATASQQQIRTGNMNQRSTTGPNRGGNNVTNIQQQQKKPRYFLAIFDYDPITMSPNPDGCEEELAFQDGDTIKVYGDKDPDGFYWGELRGRRGYVPHNMVTEIEEGQVGAQGGVAGPSGVQSVRGVSRDRWADIYANMPVKRMIALYDYDPQELSPNVDAEQVELSFKTGEVILVYGDMDEDGFFMGELDGVRGLVPSNFLTDAPDQYNQVSGSGPPRNAPNRTGGMRGPGPGARGPPPPPRDGMGPSSLMQQNQRGTQRKDARPTSPTLLDNTGYPAPDHQTQVMLGKGGMIGPAGNMGQQQQYNMQGGMRQQNMMMNQQNQQHQQQPTTTASTGGVFSTASSLFSGATSAATGGLFGSSNRQPPKGPQVVPQPGIMPQQQQQMQQQHQQSNQQPQQGGGGLFGLGSNNAHNSQMQQQQNQQMPPQPGQGPNLMQKLGDITAPGGDILSKGKELIFMKFGLGGK